MKKVLVVALIIIVTIVFFMDNIVFSKQIILLDSLKQISSIILAITGAWAAIIYPDALKNLVLKAKNYDKDIKSIINLLNPMIYSIAILTIIIIIEITAFILKGFHIDKQYIPFLRDISLTIIIYLYFLQIYALLTTLLPINNELINAKKEFKKNEYLDKVNNK